MPISFAFSDIKETQEIAEVLFMQFCKDRFKREGIDDLPPYEDEVVEETNFELVRLSLNQTNQYSNPLLTALGRDLRRIAESFENSREREQIKETVEEMDIVNIDLKYDHFKTILTELFTNGGITREKIVILFFFCSDLALKAFNNNYIYYCIKLLSWSLRFIFEFVCDWVQSKGGWENVLSNYVPKFIFTTAGFLSCVALAVYIRKNL